MKKLIFIFSILFFTLPLSGQLRLNVTGDARITGRLDLRSLGSGNVFVGENAGTANTTGGFNTFVGRDAGLKNTEGFGNTFIGGSSGEQNMSGVDNIFLGGSAGRQNTTGSSNTFLGRSAGFSNTSGNQNTFVGINAGRSNTTGYQNTFVGREAGYSNQTGTGSTNTFVGEGAGYTNQDGNGNTFVGRWAGRSNVSGRFNAFLGSSAGQDNTNASFNTFLGDLAGYTNTTGQRNTFVGWAAGAPNTTGSDLTAFGAQSGASIFENTPVENAFAFGSNALMIQSNSGVLGNLSMQEIGGYVNWSTDSDGRMKADVQEDVKGLDFVLQLRPVTYRVNTGKLNSFIQTDKEVEKREFLDEKEGRSGKALQTAQTVYQLALEAKSRIRYTGFIAQEVEKAAEKTGFEFSGLIKPAHIKDHYSLRYAEFVVPLVKSVQEQQAIILKQEAEIQKLTTQYQELRLLVEKLIVQKQGGSQGNGDELDLKQKAMLAQNQPNPFLHDTVIDYFIPAEVQKALIQVTSDGGQVLGRVIIREFGKGQVKIKTETYPSGTYFYSLFLDGKLFETKRMVLMK